MRNLWDFVDLECNCGYLTFANIGVPDFGCAQRERVVRLGRVYKNFSPGSVKTAKITGNCIANENFAFESENNTVNKEQVELQSPVESHFALTPVNNSESSSPANGFTNQESTELLQEELDKLEILENSKKTKADALLSPTDEHINMFSRASDKEKEPIGDGVEVDSNPNGEVKLSFIAYKIIFTLCVSFFF